MPRGQGVTRDGGFVMVDDAALAAAMDGEQQVTESSVQSHVQCSFVVLHQPGQQLWSRNLLLSVHATVLCDMKEPNQ